MTDDRPHPSMTRDLALGAGRATGRTTGRTTLPSAAWLLTAAAFLAGFAVLTAGIVATGGVDRVDTAVFRAVGEIRGPALTRIASTVTSLGWFPVVLLTALLAAALLRRRTGGWFSSTVLVAAVAATACTIYLTKIAVARVRPGADSLVGVPAVDFSFPSGHTGDGSVVFVLGAALVAVTVRRPLSRALLIGGGVLVALAVGVSRVYLGYHWATDVVGGWVLATSVTCVGVYAVLVQQRTATPPPGTGPAPGLPLPAVRERHRS